MEIGQLVEIKESGIRLNVTDIDDTLVTLGVNDIAIIQVNMDDIRTIPESKFVWLDIADGKFSNTWHTNEFGFLNREHILKEYEEYLEHFPKEKVTLKLIEYTPLNCDFEFSQLMTIK